MTAIRSDADHRKRILEHQERVSAEAKPAAEGLPSDRQLRMPLIGEVRRPEPPQPKRRRQKPKKPVQPQLGDA